MAKLLSQQSTAVKYSFITPVPSPQWKAIVRADECLEAAQDDTIFTSPYNMKLRDLGLVSVCRLLFLLKPILLRSA